MNKQWEMKAFLPKNESHFSCFNPTSPRRTIHHDGAEADVCFRRRTCADVIQPCRATLKAGIRKPEMENQNPESGIRNPESGIRNPESGIENDDRKIHLSNV